MTLLGLGKHCSLQEVKSVYLKLAKKYHPDVAMNQLRNTGDQVEDDKKAKAIEDRFKELSQANERLQSWIEERDQALK